MPMPLLSLLLATFSLPAVAQDAATPTELLDRDSAAAVAAVRQILSGSSDPTPWAVLADGLRGSESPRAATLSAADLARTVADSLTLGAESEPSFLARMKGRGAYAWSNLRGEVGPSLSRHRDLLLSVGSGAAGVLFLLWVGLRVFARREGRRPSTDAPAAPAPAPARTPTPRRIKRGRSTRPTCRDAARLEDRIRSLDAA